jgi:peptidoglycan/xylan/chitin deacetylase (PgdA/CDA1 family)
MLPSKAQLFRAALDTLYATGAYRLFGRGTAGVGLIFTLHHVRPEPPGQATGFAPNRILEITPEFLDATLGEMRDLGIEVISLDEMVRRFEARDFGKRFACFTLDDGYADNLTEALPVFERHDAPFTVYVTTGLPEGRVEMWWVELERIVRDNPEIEWEIGGVSQRRSSVTEPEKWAAFNNIYWSVRTLPLDEQNAFTERMATRYGIDRAALCVSDSLTWEQVAALARHPLCTIGAHTEAHSAMAKLSEAEITEDIERCLKTLEEVTGERPRHFAYPYGDAGSAARREFELMARAGFASAVTTRKGVLFPEHADHLLALPRVSLNGEYQEPRYVRLYASGAPFALWNGFKRLDVI